MVEVRPGVFWLRMPVDGELGSINVWALANADTWLLIDSGLRTPATTTGWLKAFEGGLSGRRVSDVMVTHLHPDHSGMAGWIVDRFEATLRMTALEYYELRTLASDTGKEPPEKALRFYHRAGWSRADLDRYTVKFGDFGKMVYPLPHAFSVLRDGDRLLLDDNEWEVVVGCGHSPEHALLYCSALQVLVSGDQVLPGISSNVSVRPQEPFANPLEDWLHSLAAIRKRVPDTVLVLPAHGLPFHGLHARIDSLINGHERGLERLNVQLGTPQRVVDVFRSLYRRRIDETLLGLATGEAMAHLSCLKGRGLASVRIADDGVAWWTRNEEYLTERVRQ